MSIAERSPDAVLIFGRVPHLNPNINRSRNAVTDHTRLSSPLGKK